VIWVAVGPRLYTPLAGPLFGGLSRERPRQVAGDFNVRLSGSVYSARLLIRATWRSAAAARWTWRALRVYPGGTGTVHAPPWCAPARGSHQNGAPRPGPPNWCRHLIGAHGCGASPSVVRVALPPQSGQLLRPRNSRGRGVAPEQQASQCTTVVRTHSISAHASGACTIGATVALPPQSGQELLRSRNMRVSPGCRAFPRVLGKDPTKRSTIEVSRPDNMRESTSPRASSSVLAKARRKHSRITVTGDCCVFRTLG
jgi:hypothetical protein